MAEDSRLIPSGLNWELEGSILSNDPAWFEDEHQYPEGWYRIRYIRGAFRYSADYGWGIGKDWKVVTRQGSVIDLFDAPSQALPETEESLPNGAYQGPGYDTQEAAENAAASLTSIDFYHDGGPIGVILYNTPYYDNVAGTPNPSWRLEELVQETESESSPVDNGGSSEPEECDKVDPVSGLLSSRYKILLDSLGNAPGGFGFVFSPGVYLTEDGPYSVLVGDISLQSSSISITCVEDNSGDDAQYIFKLGVSQDFLDSFCVEIKGAKGETGDQGPKGKPGRHGVGDGPPGEDGLPGTNAAATSKFTGIKVIESDEIYDNAIVNLVLSPSDGILETVRGKMAVPDNDSPAIKVAASPIFRDVQFGSGGPNISLDNWTLYAPINDPVSTLTNSSDLDIIRLPSGWNGQFPGPVPISTMKLSGLISLVISYYKGKADEIISTWDANVSEYVNAKDVEARRILADLAQELTEAEWSAPVDFCIEFDPLNCPFNDNNPSNETDPTSGTSGTTGTDETGTDVTSGTGDTDGTSGTGVNDCSGCDGSGGDTGCSYTVGISGGTFSGPYQMIPRGNCFWSLDYGDGSVQGNIQLIGGTWHLTLTNSSCTAVFTAPLDTGTDPVCPPTSGYTQQSSTCGSVSIVVTKDCDDTDPIPTCDFFEKAGGGDEGFDETYDVAAAFSTGLSEAIFDLIWETYLVKDRILITDSEGNTLLDSGCIATLGPKSYQFVVRDDQSPIRIQVFGACEGDTTNWYWRLSCQTPLPDCCNCDFTIDLSDTAEIDGEYNLKYRGNCLYSNDTLGIDRETRILLRIFGGKWTLSASDGNRSIIWDGPDVLTSTCPPTGTDDWEIVFNSLNPDGDPVFTLVQGECTGGTGGDCGINELAGGTDSYSETYDISSAFAGTVGEVVLLFTYNTFYTQTKISVKSSNGTVLFLVDCEASGGDVKIPMTFTSGDSPITVEVDTSCTTQAAQWHYSITCPDVGGGTCGLFNWNAPSACEPYMTKGVSDPAHDCSCEKLPNGVCLVTTYVRQSGPGRLHLDDEVQLVSFEEGSWLDDILVMMKPGETIQEIWDLLPHSAVTFNLPQDCILFANTHGSFMSEETTEWFATSPKTFTEIGTSNELILPEGNQDDIVLDDHRALRNAGFTVMDFSVGVPVSVLQAKGFVDGNNEVNFKFGHITCGRGGVGIEGMTCGALCKCWYVFQAVYTCGEGWSTPTLIETTSGALPPYPVGTWTRLDATDTGDCAYVYVVEGDDCIETCAVECEQCCMLYRADITTDLGPPLTGGIDIRSTENQTFFGQTIPGCRWDGADVSYELKKLYISCKNGQWNALLLTGNGPNVVPPDIARCRLEWAAPFDGTSSCPPETGWTLIDAQGTCANTATLELFCVCPGPETLFLSMSGGVGCDCPSGVVLERADCDEGNIPVPDHVCGCKYIYTSSGGGIWAELVYNAPGSSTGYWELRVQCDGWSQILQRPEGPSKYDPNPIGGYYAFGEDTEPSSAYPCVITEANVS